MPYDGVSQVLCGPYSADDIPDYQAALIHIEGQWFDFFSKNHIRMILCVANRTVRFGKLWAYIPKTWFFSGHGQNEDNGYAGQNPIPIMSDTNYNRLQRELIETGVLIRKGDYYRLDFSVNAVDLTSRQSIIDRVSKEHFRGGPLKHAKGIIEWSMILTSRYLNQQLSRASHAHNLNTGSGTKSVSFTTCKDSVAANQNKSPLSGGTTGQGPCSLNTLTKKAGTRHLRKTFRPSLTIASSDTSDVSLYKTHVISSDKSSEIGAQGEILKASAESLKATILATVKEKRDKVLEKRKRRLTLADQVKLFDGEWIGGQREFSGGMVPTRIVSRADIRLLKDQILTPFRSTDMDPVHFAYWVSSNWGAIGAQYFAKAKSYPRYPAFRYLVAARATFIEAYVHRDDLDTTRTLSQSDIAKRAKAYEASSEKLQAAAERFEERTTDLKQQLEEAHKEIAKLRKEAGLAEDDDPAYARVIRVAKRKPKIGRFE